MTLQKAQTFQCSIIITYISKIGSVEGRFLGFYYLSSDPAEAVFQLIYSVLEHFSYKKKNYSTVLQWSHVRTPKWSTGKS